MARSKALYAVFRPSFILVLAGLIFCGPARGLEADRIELLEDRQYAPELISLLEDARQSVKVCMFQAVVYPGYSGSPGNAILSALAQARKRGVSVEVVLEDGGSLEEVKRTNRQAAEFLKKSGVDVYLDGEGVTTHTKFVIIDSAIAVVGSTNWTYAALAKNHELSVVLHSRDVALKMNRYFESVRCQGKKF